MPVSLLLVEGALDSKLLTPVLGTLVEPIKIERVGSKGSLKPRCQDRREARVAACYIRDRDFDFDPPQDLSRPTIDSREKGKGSVLGWRWCRHEIENYLLEPALVAAATGWGVADYTAELLRASQHLTYYSAARWSVGVARRSLPPLKELPTRPQDLGNPIEIPADCSQGACFGWAQQCIESFRQQVDGMLAPTTLQGSLAEYTRRLSALSSTEEVLIWHSGKDLIAALTPSLAQELKETRDDFITRLLNWVWVNPEAALTLLPEWQALLTLLED